MNKIVEWVEMNIFNIHRDAESTIKALLSVGSRGEMSTDGRHTFRRWTVGSRTYMLIDENLFRCSETSKPSRLFVSIDAFFNKNGLSAF
jgi:hypothetical protein